MPWPQATDYNAAVQNPHLCFADHDLRQGQAAGDPFGLPLPHSGNFADVYQFTCPGDKRWAVKRFTREVHGLRERYQAVSNYLREHPRRFLVGFTYLEEGVRVHNAWWPVLKMDWVEGYALNEFTAQQADRPGVLERLAHLWLRLARELREAEVGHGDLQHGNVLLVPGDKGNVALRLIDYDGLWVPALAHQPSAESGHPNYQHPQRLREGDYGREVDRFSHLVIYTALRCTAVGGRGLWSKYENAENLLFREADFRLPHQSTLLRDLWNLGGEARLLVGQLLIASAGPLSSVPLLDDLLDDNRVRPLTLAEEDLVRGLLRLPVNARPSGGELPGALAGALPPLPSALVGGAVELEPTIVRRTDPLFTPVGQPANLVEWGQGPPLGLSSQAASPPLAARPVEPPSFPMAIPIPQMPQLEPVQLPLAEEPTGRRIVEPWTPVPVAEPVLPPIPRRQGPAMGADAGSKPEILLIEVPSDRPALPPVPKRARPSTAKPMEDPLATTWTWLTARPLLVSGLIGGFLLLALLILTALLIALVKGH